MKAGDRLLRHLQTGSVCGELEVGFSLRLQKEELWRTGELSLFLPGVRAGWRSGQARSSAPERCARGQQVWPRL